MSSFFSNSENHSSSSTYTHLDAWLKEIPELKEKPVNIQLGDLSGADRITSRTINRIAAPLDTVQTLEDLSIALHKVEENAKNLKIFSRFNVNIPSMKFDNQSNKVNVFLDVDCEELRPTPLMHLRLKKNTLGDIDLESGAYVANVFGEAERFHLLASLNKRKAYEIGAAATLPLLDYQGVREVSMYCGYGKEATSFNTMNTGNNYTQLKVAASLIGNHQIEWNYKKRYSMIPKFKDNKLNALTYRYYWDETRKNEITGIRERGIYSDIECTMASFNSSPRFVKSRLSTHGYMPLKYLNSVASLHLNISGLQPLHSDYSSTTFNKINEKIHPMDRLYTHVRGFTHIGHESASSDTNPGEALGGNFSVNVEGKITTPLKFLNMIYDLTKIHGQAFIQAGNVIPLDFEKGDIERAQKNFVETARASYGIGAFIALQHLRFELNYCRRLNLGSYQNDNNFSRLEFNVATEF